MKTKKYIFILPFILLFISEISFCSDTDAFINVEDLRLFLLKGYKSAKAVIDDVRIEYQTSQISVNALPKDLYSALKKITNIDTTIPYEELFSFTDVEEYIQKNGKERWVFLYNGKSKPSEDVSDRTKLLKTKDSPRFVVFDGQYILDYMSVKDHSRTVGRAIYDASNTGFFESNNGQNMHAPIFFFGYMPGCMPDDILSNPQVEIETKPELINGLLAYKVRSKIAMSDFIYDISYWLSPERSCLPVITEVWENGIFKRRIEANEFIELEDGRWVVKSIRQRNFIANEDNEPLEIRNKLYTIRNIDLHPEIEEDIFSTSFSDLLDGVEVEDRTTGLRYFIDEGPVSDQLISNIRNETLELLIEDTTETIEEEEIAKTDLFDDINKPLFTDKGILASQTTQIEKENKISVLHIILVITGIFAIGLIAISLYRRSF